MMRRLPLTLAGVLLVALLLCAAVAAQNTAPGAPQNVQVLDRPNDTGTALRLVFARSADDGAGANDVVSYKVFQRLPGGAATYLTPITATGAASYALVISGLTAGQQYGIGVSAWDGALASATTVVWATPVDNVTPPPPPQNVIVSDVANDLGVALRLTFTRSSDDRTGGDVVGYKVFKRLPGGAPTYLPMITATGAASYALNITGLTAGQQYGIGVASFDGTLTSGAVVVWGTPVDNITPEPPASLTLADPPADKGDNLTATFAKSPDDAVGGSVTSYQVYKRTSETAFSLVTTVTATHAANYTVTLSGLTRGTKYGVGVRASDGSHLSAYVVKWGTPLDTVAPRPPRDPLLVNPPTDNGTTMQLTFSASLDDVAGGDVVRYRFYKRTSSTGLQQCGSIAATRASIYSFVFSGLTVGTRYGFAVSAYDGVNESEKVLVWGDSAPPGAPRNVQLLDQPNDDGVALKLVFTNSVDDGGGSNDVTQYRVFRRTEGTSLALLTTLKATGASTYVYVLEGLTKGTNYGVAVCAWDGFQESARVTKWLTPVDDTPPAAPGTPTVADWPSDDGTALSVTFTASPDDNNTDPEVGRYIVYRGTAATGAGTKAGEVTATKAASYTFKSTGLTAGTTYWYWIVAAGASGASVPTARVSGTPADQRPVAAPTNLQGVDHPYDTGGVVDLTWNRSTDDGTGTKRVTKYYVYCRMANAQVEPVQIGQVTATGAASYAWSDTNVEIDLVLYEYTVKAATATGALSAAAGPVRVAAENNNAEYFAAPTNLSATPSGSGKVTLTWNRSTGENDMGGPPPPPIISPKGGYGGDYEFYRRTAGGSYGVAPTFTVSAAGTNDPMTYLDSGLTNGTTYYYKLRYRRYNLVSPFTPEVSAKPSATAALSGSDGSGGTGDDGSAVKVDDGAAALTVSLSGVPGQVAAGKDLTVQACVSGSGASSVCLEYAVGSTLIRTAAVNGVGAYRADLKLRTSGLSGGSVVSVRALVSGSGGLNSASAVSRVVVGG